MDHIPQGASAFGPDQVRRLRGPRSRAAFARELGVTPQTVYRWELPDSAAEARRPRGSQLARLLQLMAAGERAELPTMGTEPASALPAGSTATVARQLTAARPPPFHDAGSAEPMRAATDGADDDLARVLPGLERIFRGDARRGHAELVHVVTSTRSLSPNVRATAYYGIALCELLDRSDPRAALLSIAPLLSDAQAGLLEAGVAAKLFAVAALCHAFPDGLLFDLGRVHAYQARVESMVGPSDVEPACIAALAVLCAAAFVGDLELLERAFAQLEESRWNALPALLELHVEEFRILRAMYAGKNALCIASCQAVAERAEQHGYPLVLARSLGRLALCELDMLGDPEHVLLLARRAKQVAAGARVGHGVHQLLSLRAEIEALLRLGRTQEAFSAAAEIDAWSVETGLPALSAVAAQVRLYNLAARVDALHALAASLRSCEHPSLRRMSQASAAYAEASALLTTHEDPRLTVASFERAETLAEGWPFLLREVLRQRVVAHLAIGDDVAARVVLRRAQRLADGFPSPWYTAHLRRLEGGLLAARGQWSEGKQLLQSAVATFDLAKDACDAALTRCLYCMITASFEQVDEAPLREARARLALLGLPEPRSMVLGVAQFRQRDGGEASSDRRVRGTSRLVVPFQRVAMRGAAPNLILSELVAVAASLFEGRTVYLEELDSAGTAHAVFGDVAPEGGDNTWIEWSDGAGRLLRIVVAGSLDADERSTLALLTQTAALSLEVAVLRSVAERPVVNNSEFPPPELPGFIAASGEMRKLRVELGRLAASRSTVIISGESGAGKEVVARTIHDLSERATRPYIAFNCATVPRELFEGQLFGYRRGAFTGASNDHPGVIRSANRGTLFLDEIAELPLDVQPKLLRFLENSEVFPLGERAPVRVDVRVIAATHRDLAQLIREGKFREDLYYRLQVVPVFVPPLRDRRADIPVLARHFLRELKRGSEPPVLAPDALLVLLEQRFPGNVRELKNILERALAYFPDQAVLRAEHLRLPAAVGM